MTGEVCPLRIKMTLKIAEYIKKDNFMEVNPVPFCLNGVLTYRKVINYIWAIPVEPLQYPFENIVPRNTASYISVLSIIPSL